MRQLPFIVVLAAVILVGCGGGSGGVGDPAPPNPGTGGGTGGDGTGGNPSVVFPKVISASPQGDTPAAVDTPIDITFNKPMMLSSFQAPMEGLDVGYDPACVDTDCVTVRLNHKTNLAYNSTYQVKLLPQVRDKEGNLLTDPYPWSFKTAVFAPPPSFKSGIMLDGGTVATDSGECTAIAVDSAGTLHIAYFSDSAGAPKHAYCSKDCDKPGSWNNEVIDTTAKLTDQKFGRDINLAIEGTTLHVSYRDVGTTSTGNKADDRGVLKYAKGVAKADGSVGTWAPVIVDDTPFGVTDTYIAVDKGRVHISYAKKGDPKATGQTSLDIFTYATCSASCDSKNSGDIEKVEIDQGKGAGSPNHIVIANDTIHMSYYLNGTLKYVTCSVSQAQNCSQLSGAAAAVVDDGEGKFDVGTENSLSIFGNTVHMTYRDNTNGLLKYARCDGNCTDSNNWTKIAIDNAGGSTQIVAVPGRLHVSYRDDLNKDLKYATCSSSSSNCLDPKSWSLFTLDAPGEVGLDTYIAVDGAGAVHISYRDASNKALKYIVGAPTQ